MKKQSFLQRWLENNYLLFLFAVIISLVVWLYMSFNTSNTNTSFAIGDVPVQIELPESTRKEGLQAFTAEDPKATVTVTGNRTVLGLVNENDLIVTATGSINSTGEFTLPVNANKRSNRANFQITDCTPSAITVTVDYYKEMEFQIQDGIVFLLADNYYGSVTLQHSTVTISGPQSEVMKIKKVIAKAYIDEKLSASREVEATLELYDENGKTVSKKLLTMSTETVKAAVNVLPEKKVAVKPVYVGKPGGLEISSDMISVTPSELLIAGPADTLEKLESVQLDPIDFSKLKNEKITFDELGVTIPENCKNISNYTTAKVTLDLSGLSSKVFTVENFKVTGLSSDYSVEVTSKSINVTVIGPKSDLEKLTADNITAVIDTSNSSGKTGSVEMPVTFTFDDDDKCWAYGTYQANVIITKK